MRQIYNDSPRDFYDAVEEAASQAENYRNHSGKRTLFLDDETGDEGPCSLEASWDYYVEDSNCNGGTELNRAFNWYEHIKNSVSYMEEKDITQDRKRLGFFSENYQETEVRTGESWKIKTPGQYCYRIKINIPNTRKHTFRWSVIRCNPYGGGPSWQEACFLTQQEADEFIRSHDLPEYPRHTEGENAF